MTYLKQNQLKKHLLSKDLINSIRDLNAIVVAKTLNKLYEEKMLDYDIITALDKNGDNSITIALKEGICIVELSAYIFALSKSESNKSYNMEDIVVEKLTYALKHPETDIHPILLLEDLIKPIYDEESVTRLVESIGGQDWLDSYYV